MFPVTFGWTCTMCNALPRHRQTEFKNILSIFKIDCYLQLEHFNQS